MPVPVNVLFQFGKELPEVDINDVVTLELKDRIAKLLSGRFIVDEQNRCILDPVGDPGNFGGPGNTELRDSVCIGIDFGPISVGYCKDV